VAASAGLGHTVPQCVQVRPARNVASENRRCIPGARFVTLQGRNHLFLETEPAFGQFLEHTRAFLSG